jgi:DNA-directed RNA polymerase sigma subunit (sigma70/sigma32)
MRGISQQALKERIEWTARRAQMLAMKEEGRTFQEVGDAFNVTRARAEQLVRRAIQERDALAMHGKKKSFREIGDALGISAEKARKLVTRLRREREMSQVAG